MKSPILIKESKIDSNRLSVHLSKSQEKERTILKKYIAGRKWEADHQY